MKLGSHPDTKMCSFLLHLNFTWPTFITGRPLHFLLDLLQNSDEAPPLAPEFAKISSVPVSACCVHTWGHIIMLYYIMQTILCSTSKLLLSVLKHFFPNEKQVSYFGYFSISFEKITFYTEILIFDKLHCGFFYLFGPLIAVLT